jgi:hypothetical protein
MTLAMSTIEKAARAFAIADFPHSIWCGLTAADM